MLLQQHMVLPILLYSSDFWGIYDYKEIDKIQLTFYKILLGTTTSGVYGELGCYPLSILCLERPMKYLLTVVNCETLIHTVFNEQIERKNETCWTKRVFDKLNMLGLFLFWNNANISLKYFQIIKQIIRDIYIQQWRTRLPESLKLDCSRKFKLNFEFESY